MRTRWIISLALASLSLGFAGCKSAANNPAPIIDMNNGPDPAAANLASAGQAPQTVAGYAGTQPARALGQRSYANEPQANGEEYTAQAEPYSQQPAYQDQPYADQNYDPADGAYDSQVDAGQQALYADQPPPPLPDYQQPDLTVPNDQWTPGYWDYAAQGYYWVPGAWVAPPYQGALWTPPYWGYEGSRYHFHHGFWALHIGFYGGIPYGHGYNGVGFEGGYWNGGQFYYNRVVQRVNITDVHNVYVRNVTVVNNNVTRVSYNGGPGGWRARPGPQELAVYREQRTPPMQTQIARVQQARDDRQQFFADNYGRPALAAVPARVSADRTPPAPLRGFEPRQPTPAAGLNRQPLEQNAAARTQQLQQRQQVVDQRQQQLAEHQQQLQQRQQALQQRENANTERQANVANQVQQQAVQRQREQQQQQQIRLQQNAQRQQAQQQLERRQTDLQQRQQQAVQQQHQDQQRVLQQQERAQQQAQQRQQVEAQRAQQQQQRQQQDLSRHEQQQRTIEPSRPQRPAQAPQRPVERQPEPQHAEPHPPKHP